jgi:alkanesulfonate monooxygenase SsuD/methylene tetrahydromethanopterin reductase-like flavin-dependent oxidoreductase (luciferase family)
MPKKRLGLVVDGQDSTTILDGIQRAEESSISAAWLITGGTQLDPLTIFSAAAVKTQRIMLGTSITPTFPRHPLTVAQQAQVIAQFAPGRFRLGLGTGGQGWIESDYRLEYRSPLSQLREHLRIVKELLQKGEVDFDGRYYQAHARLPAPIDIPVMASALGPKAFEMCGAEADGAISWVCPRAYLREIAVPAIKKGADRADRQAPPLIAHALVCVNESLPEVADGVREQFAYYITLRHYQRVFTAVGFPESIEGIWSDAMVDAVALYGNESQVAEQIEELFSGGAGEVYVSVVTAGSDRAASLDRTLRLLGREAEKLADQ